MQEIVKPNLKTSIEDRVKGNTIFGHIKYPVKSRFRLIYAAIFMFLTLVFIALYKINGKFDYFVIVTFALSIYYFYSHFTYLIYYIKKNSPPIFSYVINEEGIKEYNDNISSFFKWENYSKAVFVKNYMIITFSDINSRLFFSSNYTAEEFSQIKDWIKAKVKVEHKN